MPNRQPLYPITVRLTGTDGNALALIGKVSAAIREHAGDTAADEFAREATGCGLYRDVLALIQRTVTVV
jgi:hypothetical protein